MRSLPWFAGKGSGLQQQSAEMFYLACLLALLAQKGIWCLKKFGGRIHRSELIEHAYTVIYASELKACSSSSRNGRNGTPPAIAVRPAVPVHLLSYHFSMANKC